MSSPPRLRRAAIACMAGLGLLTACPPVYAWSPHDEFTPKTREEAARRARMDAEAGGAPPSYAPAYSYSSHGYPHGQPSYGRPSAPPFGYPSPAPSPYPNALPSWWSPSMPFQPTPPSPPPTRGFSTH